MNIQYSMQRQIQWMLSEGIHRMAVGLWNRKGKKAKKLAWQVGQWF
jgi:hypothetical protein